jgi:hypothetical protein
MKYLKAAVLPIVLYTKLLEAAGTCLPLATNSDLCANPPGAISSDGFNDVCVLVGSVMEGVTSMSRYHRVRLLRASTSTAQACAICRICEAVLASKPAIVPVHLQPLPHRPQLRVTLAPLFVGKRHSQSKTRAPRFPVGIR